jgi:hypothetical protein
MNDYSLPAGVAVKLHAGEQLLLNLHLFNVTDAPIEGTSGILVQVAEADQIEHEAESVLAGSISFSIPPHSRDFVQSGTCTMVQDEALIAVGGHAHMHATHIKVIAHSSIDGDVVLSDRDFSFDASRLYGLDPLVRMKQGDKVQIDCTFDNDGDTPITFGDSSLDEMCFAGIFRYPPAEHPQYLCPQ